MLIPSELRDSPPDTEFIQTIYSLNGYGHDSSKLPALLKSINAVLIDIRFSPSIQPLKFNKEYLKLLLKDKYQHLPLLGNRAADAKVPAIQNLSAGLKIILKLKANPLIFCVCENDSFCHRHVIAKQLIKENVIIHNLKDFTLSDASNCD